MLSFKFLTPSPRRGGGSGWGRIFLCFILTLHVTNSFSGNDNKAIVFYSTLMKLNSAANTNEANALQQTMLKCFFCSESSGIQLPSEGLDGFSASTSNLYTMQLFYGIYKDKELVVQSASVTKTEPIYQPDQSEKKQKEGVTQYMNYVTKTYKRNGKATTYYDRVCTLKSTGLIVDICNCGASDSGNDNTVKNDKKKKDDTGKKEPIVNRDINLQIEQLRARAAYYYTKHKYEQSYQYYEQLVDRAPTDGDAHYRIALLTFWRKGCKKRFTAKEARALALDHIDCAISYGNSEIRDKATVVKLNWQNDNIYF